MPTPNGQLQSPSSATSQSPPTVATPQLSAATSQTAPASVATFATSHTASVAATSTQNSRKWSSSICWQNFVSLIAVIGFAVTLYYASRGDHASGESIQYSIKSWVLSAWSAKKVYCEFKSTYKVKEVTRYHEVVLISSDIE